MSQTRNASSGPCFRFLDDGGESITIFDTSVYIQLALLVLLNAYGYFKVYRAQRHWETQGGTSDARPSSLLLPIYRWLMWFMCGCLLAGRIVVSIQTYSYTRPNSLSSSIAYGVSNMQHQTSYELVTFAFMSPGAGKRTYKRSLQLAVIWGVLCGFLKFAAAFTSHTEHDSLAIVLELSWGIGLFVFYAILWLLPNTTYLQRRPALRRYSRFWTLAYSLQIIWMCLRFQLIDAGYCLYIGHLAVIVLFAPWVVYGACKEDSFYWQGAAVFTGHHQRSIATVLGGFLSPSLAADVSQVDAFHVPLINFAALTIDEKNLQQGNSMMNNMDQPYQPSRWTVFSSYSNNSNPASHRAGAVRDADSSVRPTASGNELFVIDHGSMARVYKGTYKAKPVAIKVLYAPELTREQVENQFEEASMMYMLSHSHVTEVKGVCVMPPAVALVMELCTGSQYRVIHKPNMYDCLRAYGRWTGNVLHSRQRAYQPSFRDNVGITQRLSYRVPPLALEVMPPSIATVLVSALDASQQTNQSENCPPIQGGANSRACVCMNVPHELRPKVPYSNDCFIAKHSPSALNKFLFDAFLHRSTREKECICGSDEAQPLIPWTVMYRTMIDVITGVATLHGQRHPVLHLDIKSGNFLVSNRGLVKIADLELSTRVPHIDACIAPNIKQLKENIQRQHQCHEKCVYRTLAIYTDEELAREHESECMQDPVSNFNLHECEVCEGLHSSYITPSTYVLPCIMPLLGGKPMVCPCSFQTNYFPSNPANAYTLHSYPFYRYSHPASVAANRAVHQAVLGNRKAGKDQVGKDFSTSDLSSSTSASSGTNLKTVKSEGIPISTHTVRRRSFSANTADKDTYEPLPAVVSNMSCHEEEVWIPKAPLSFERPSDQVIVKKRKGFRGVLNNLFGVSNKEPAREMSGSVHNGSINTASFNSHAPLPSPPELPGIELGSTTNNTTTSGELLVNNDSNTTAELEAKDVFADDDTTEPINHDYNRGNNIQSAAVDFDAQSDASMVLSRAHSPAQTIKNMPSSFHNPATLFRNELPTDIHDTVQSPSPKPQTTDTSAIMKSPKIAKSVVTAGALQQLSHHERSNTITSLELIPMFLAEMEKGEMSMLDAQTVKSNLSKELTKRHQTTTLLLEKQRSWMVNNSPKEAIEQTNFNSQVQLDDGAVATINTSPEDPLGVCPDVHIGWNFTVKQGMIAHQVLYDNPRCTDENDMTFLHCIDAADNYVPKSKVSLPTTQLLSRNRKDSVVPPIMELPRRNSFYLQNDHSSTIKRTKTQVDDLDSSDQNQLPFRNSFARSPPLKPNPTQELDVHVESDILQDGKMPADANAMTNDDEDRMNEDRMTDTNPPLHVRGVFIPQKQCYSQGYTQSITLINMGYLVILKANKRMLPRMSSSSVRSNPFMYGQEGDNGQIGWMLPVSHLSRKPELVNSTIVNQPPVEDTFCCGIHFNDGIGQNHEEDARRHRNKQKHIECEEVQAEVQQQKVCMDEYEPFEWTQLQAQDHNIVPTEEDHKEERRKKPTLSPPGQGQFKQLAKQSTSRCCSIVKKHPMKSNTTPLVLPQCLYWLAPEVIRLEPVSVKTDVYSLGCVLYEILHRKVPFQDLDIMFQNSCRKDMALYSALCERYFIENGSSPPMEFKAHLCVSADVRLARAIAYGHIRPHIASHVPLAMRGVLRRLWHPDPEARPHSALALMWTRVAFARAAAGALDEDTVYHNDGYYLWQQTEKEAQWQGLNLVKIEEQVVAMEQEEKRREHNMLTADPNGVFWYGCLCCRMSFNKTKSTVPPPAPFTFPINQNALYNSNEGHESSSQYSGDDDQ